MASIHSPKNKFRVEIVFDKAIKGLGSVVSYTAASVSACMSLASRYTDATVVIQENQQAYPSFNWQTVKKYKI